MDDPTGDAAFCMFPGCGSVLERKQRVCEAEGTLGTCVTWVSTGPLVLKVPTPRMAVARLQGLWMLEKWSGSV